MPGYNEDKGGEQNGRVDRRKFLKCMAWTGTGLVWTVSAGGLLTACGDLATATSTPPTTAANAAATTAATTSAATTMAPATTSAATTAAATADFTFVQLSDTHIGFNGEGINTDVVGTARQSIEHINALAARPALVIHTGDVSHNSKPSEFDTAYQLMNTIKTDQVFYVPGEHDLLNDKGAAYNQRFQQKGGKAWYSMDFKGVHFIALSNSGELDAFGKLGSEQLDWLKQDLAGVKKDSSIVVFAHVPLYSLYPEWGWETKDADQAMQLLMPYSAVTVLNGHIHQVLSKVEGNITFYTANATAFPQHRPGVEKPNAYKLPAGDLLRSIGYRTVTITPGKPGPQITDTTLAGTPAETVGPVTVSTSTTATPSATTAPVATVATKTGQVDAGPLTDFSAATPRQVTFNQPDQKGPTTLFVVQNGKDYLALSDICTHQGCEVNWSQSANLFLCPCHGSQYDLQGKNVGGPAPKPLSRYKTEVVDGHLVITLQA